MRFGAIGQLTDLALGIGVYRGAMDEARVWTEASRQIFRLLSCVLWAPYSTTNMPILTYMPHTYLSRPRRLQPAGAWTVHGVLSPPHKESQRRALPLLMSKRVWPRD